MLVRLCELTKAPQETMEGLCDVTWVRCTDCERRLFACFVLSLPFLRIVGAVVAEYNEHEHGNTSEEANEEPAIASMNAPASRKQSLRAQGSFAKDTQSLS